MRIPFPERVPLWYAGIFAFCLGAGQLLTGTDPTFTLYCFAFVLFAAVAFNLAGGFTRPSGSYVFFFSVLALLVGLITKIVLGEPAQTHLRAPLTSIAAYAGGMASMAVAIYLSRRVARRKGLLQETVTLDNMYTAAIGCVVTGIAIPFIGEIVGSDGDNILTPIFTASNQLNRFLPMAVILGVTYEIKSSGGRRSINIPVLISFAYQFFMGTIIGFSKEALFGPAICWLAAGAALGYNFRRVQIFGGIVVFYLFAHWMVPYCQYGRIFRSETNTLSQSVAVSVDLLTHLDDVRAHYLEDAENLDRTETKFYFEAPQGLFDRLQMISMDDALNEVTDQNGPLGMRVIYLYLANIVPHVVWKNKPNVNMANVYGHEIKAISDDDDVTSISFSPIGESYRIAGWYGIFLVAPAIWFFLFLIMDSLCGDLRKSPWGILALATFAHTAPEGGIGGPIYLMTYGSIVIIFVAFFSAYVMPLVSSLILPARRTFVPLSLAQLTRNARSPRTFVPSSEPPRTNS